MDQLYQDRILEFARAVRAASQIDSPTHQASVSNPTCGDRVDVRLVLKKDVVAETTATARGCALCEAGAGLLISIAATRPKEDLARMRDTLSAWLAGDDTAEIDKGMEVFQPVRAIRNRHKCVTLAFDAAVRAAASQD